MLIAAVHNAGLVCLTHTPSPMGFLNEILARPQNERPFLILVVGYPAEDAKVPDISKKSTRRNCHLPLNFAACRDQLEGRPGFWLRKVPGSFDRMRRESRRKGADNGVQVLITPSAEIDDQNLVGTHRRRALECFGDRVGRFQGGYDAFCF